MKKYSSVVCAVFFALIASVWMGQVRAQEPSSPVANSAFLSPFEGIKKTYFAIMTLEASFHQKIFIASLKKERESDGEFSYKKQKGFLWKYKVPKAMYFLYDGKYIWQGDEDKPFVIKDKIRKAKTGGTFLDLIEDIATIDELFTLTQQTKSGDLDVLELAPKKEGTVTAAKIWIDKQNRVRKIEIHEFTGNVNAIEFSSIKINQPIEAGKFTFKPEKDKQIVER
ncbi:MAG: outer membrane lipoprotein carrier protein LolA [Syntrophobacterales bacterium]|nr:outer membrane lipoprotein carrier protein LolA [Syntrophobacterales bacterium]